MNIFKCTLQRNMKQIKHNNLRIPTGRRLQTSWLFTKRGGVEFGTTETNPASGRVEDLNLGHPDYKSSALTTWPRRLHVRHIKLVIVHVAFHCTCISRVQSKQLLECKI